MRQIVVSPCLQLLRQRPVARLEKWPGLKTPVRHQSISGKAWQFFRALAPTYRRDFVVWIHVAKRPETRERRIRESIRLLAAGKKLGLK